MLNFKNEYYTLEKGRVLYPTAFINLDSIEVFGSKEGGITATEDTAHVFKVPKNYYTLNGGNIDFSKYPNGIENVYQSIKIVNLEPLISLPVNFNEFKDITPGNLKITFEKLGETIKDVQKRLSEVGLYIDSNLPGEIGIPKLPVGCTWYCNQDGHITAIPINELYSKFQQMIDKLHKDIKDLLDIDYGNFNQGLRDKTDLLLNELTNLNLKLEASIKNLTIKKNEELITTGNQKKQEIIDETNNQLNILAGVGLSLKPKQVSDIEFLKRVNAKENEVYEVLGYYKFNDGATHKRIISTTDDGSGVLLNNGLYANILHNGEVNVSWFGCKYNSLESARLNYTNLLKAINYNQTINITSDLYIEQNRDNVVTSENLILKGKDNAKLILCANFEKSDWFLINKNLKNLSFTDLEVKFNGTTDRTSVLFSIYGMIKVNNCNIENCIFNINTSERLIQWLNANTNIKPDLSLHGFDVFNLRNNIFNNILNSFILLSDVIYKEFNIIDNKINNFYHTFINCGTENGNTFSNEITNSKLLTNICNNIIINGDNFILNSGKKVDYYCFVLFEANVINYKNNYIEGIKSQDVCALYDSYFGGNYLYYENNTWKNNLCFNSGKVNNVLLKSKSVVNKYYKNNIYLIEEEWLNKFNVPEEARWIDFHEQVVKSNDIVIDNNFIDVYSLRFYQSSPSVTNYFFTNNKIYSKKAERAISIPAYYAEEIPSYDFVIKDNIFNFGETEGLSFFTSYSNNVTKKNMYKNIIISRNTLAHYSKASNFIFYGHFCAKNVIVTDNNFIHCNLGNDPSSMFSDEPKIIADLVRMNNNNFFTSNKTKKNMNWLTPDIIPKIKTNTTINYTTEFGKQLNYAFKGYFEHRKAITDIPKIDYRIKFTIDNSNNLDEILYLFFSLEKKNGVENLTFYNSVGSLETVTIADPSLSSIIRNTFYLLDENKKITKECFDTAVQNNALIIYKGQVKDYDRLKFECRIIGG